jgi:hypothetical protein
MLLYWQPDISSMQSPTTTNSSTSSASSQPIVGEPSSQGHSAQTVASSTRPTGQGHKPNGQKTNWLQLDLMSIFGLP